MPAGGPGEGSATVGSTPIDGAGERAATFGGGSRGALDLAGAGLKPREALPSGQRRAGGALGPAARGDSLENVRRSAPSALAILQYETESG